MFVAIFNVETRRPILVSSVCISSLKFAKTEILEILKLPNIRDMQTSHFLKSNAILPKLQNIGIKREFTLNTGNQPT